MCGLAGLLDPSYSTPGGALRARAATMARTMQHRGPDEESVWSDSAAGVALAFRRLAIVDLSRAGRQPMASADGRHIVMLNGEIYNAADLRDDVEAEAGSVRWRGHSDTEALVEAIALWGFEAAVAAANGMFAVAAWDRKTRTLSLARDRMGKKPLYYGWVGRQFAFASELKALLTHPGFDRTLNPEAVAQSLQLGYVLGEHSIYAGVKKLPAGHALTVRVADFPNRRTVPTEYWSQHQAALEGLSAQASGDTATLDELGWLLEDAVRIRSQADVPVGSLLSGGIDSSLVTGHMAALHPAVRTFSVGFEGAPWDEAPHAEAVARHLGTRHDTLYIGHQHVLATVEQLAGMFDEPFADHSAIPMAMLSRFARQEVTVALSGDGGDELFGGYARYAEIERWMGRRAAVPRVARPALERLCRSVVAPLAYRMGSRKTVRRLGLLGTLLADGGAATFSEQLALHLDDPRALLPGSQAVRRPLAGLSRVLPGGTPMDEVLLLESRTALVDDILTKVDRTSMAASLEVRCPLLDYRVVELSWRIPYREKNSGGVGKRPLRELLYRRVPRPLVDRPKIGFGAPIEQWLRGSLHDWAATLMSPAALAQSGLLDVPAAAVLWTDFTRGRSFQPLLWHVLMFQAWHQSASARTVTRLEPSVPSLEEASPAA